MISGSWKSSKLAMVVTGVLLSVGAAHVSANETVALKHALYGSGYEIQNVNPSMDAATRSALEAYQSDHPGLQVTGELNEGTKKALGLATAELGVSQASTIQTAKVDTATVTREDSAEGQKDDEIEEEDDGGWSFF